MISNVILAQIEKLAMPGSIITYTDLNNTKDKTTISDPNNEIHKQIKSGKVTEIVVAIYKNAKYKGTIGYDTKGNLHIIDDNSNIKPISVKIMGDTLTVIDPINNKKTQLQFTKKSGTSPIISLQDQLLTSLKKRKMNDAEVLELIKNMSNIKK